HRREDSAFGLIPQAGKRESHSKCVKLAQVLNKESRNTSDFTKVGRAILCPPLEKNCGAHGVTRPTISAPSPNHLLGTPIKTQPPKVVGLVTSPLLKST